jgi:hypothetical protein
MKIMVRGFNERTLGFLASFIELLLVRQGCPTRKVQGIGASIRKVVDSKGCLSFPVSF